MKPDKHNMTLMMNTRKIIGQGLAALLTALLLVQPLFAQQRVLLDKVIAIVDSDVVLQSELLDRLNEIRATAAMEGRPLPPENQLREDILESLIIENIQLQFAERNSIRFDDDTINRVLTSMAAESGMQFQEYVAALESQGVYLRTREQVRKQLTMQELQRGAVNSRIHITEQEIDNFLNSEMGQAIISPDYLIDHILVPVDVTDTQDIKAAKLAFASDMVAKLEEGVSVAETRSGALRAGTFAIDGTNFAWRKLDQLPSLFASAVEPLAIKEVAGPIEAGNGYHIIQLRDKRGGDEQLVNQTNLRHILLTPNEIRDEQQTEELIHEFRRRIVEDGEDFAAIARQNSDDAGSVVAGGDLDWVSEGGMPVEMEAIVDRLEIGELSEPFRTQSGWHIAEVLERRQTDLSRQYTRSQAYNTLRNRKFDLELQNWLIEIREEAFVEFID